MDWTTWFQITIWIIIVLIGVAFALSKENRGPR